MSLDALERSLEEIEVLEAIYGNDLAVKSPSALQKALSAIERKDAHQATLAQFELELSITLDHGGVAKLQCIMPPGYLENCALNVEVISVDGLSRSGREELSAVLSSKAESLVGNEAVMQLVQELQDVAPTIIEKYNTQRDPTMSDVTIQESTHSGFGRQWIWVHHIVDKGRLKSIVQEACALSLGGYLKPGYPGIVVIEGRLAACNEFVTWVKGNKSRPGGFGRNWGHHVKGQVEFPNEAQRRLSRNFEQVEPDMAVFGACCKECGLESEFLEYVMQHG